MSTTQSLYPKAKDCGCVKFVGGRKKRRTRRKHKKHHNNLLRDHCLKKKSRTYYEPRFNNPPTLVKAKYEKA